MYNKEEIYAYLKDIDIIATDVDDTLTINGLLTSEVISALEKLKHAGKKIILVTGRSGGACTTLSQYLPVEMVIAENGGVIIKNHDIKAIHLPHDHSERLHKCFENIIKTFPYIKPAQDNPFRLTDLSIDNRSIHEHELTMIKDIAQSFGLTIVVSSVQTHILSNECSKGNTLKSVTDGKKLVTIGDSANDESMFNPQLFPLSVGVVNISRYLDKMYYKPRWIMSKAEGHGFIEFANILLSP